MNADACIPCEACVFVPVPGDPLPDDLEILPPPETVKEEAGDG